MRLAGIGAVAGAVAWILHRVLRGFLDREPLGTAGLLFAVLRGALLGAILALILATYWKWASKGPGGRRSG